MTGLIAASVADPEMPFKRTAVCTIIAAPVLTMLFVIIFLMTSGAEFGVEAGR